MKGTMSNDNHTITFYFYKLLKNTHVVSEHIMNMYSSGADPGFDQGGTPDRDRPKLPTVRSSVMRVK